MKSYLSKVLLVIQDGLSKETCVAAYLFAGSVIKLGRKSGWLHCSLYLKQCSSSLMMAYGGSFSPDKSLALPVSLTRKGYPRIIPSFHRRLIYRRDDRADQLVQIYLSFFSLSKIILLAKRITRKGVFATIVDPVKDLDSVLTLVGDMLDVLPELLNRYCPSIATIPLNQGMVWTPTWKTLPTFRLTKAVWLKRCGLVWDRFVATTNSLFTSLPYELAAFQWLLVFVHSRGEQWSQGSIWNSRTRYALDPKNKLFCGLDLDWFESRIGRYLPSCDEMGIPLSQVDWVSPLKAQGSGASSPLGTMSTSDSSTLSMSGPEGSYDPYVWMERRTRPPL